MPDNIERTIYKLELDSSGYINGVEQLSASTKKLTDQQDRANKALQASEAALKNTAEWFEKSKKDLDNYTGSNERYRKQLEKSFKDASANQVKLTQLVADNRKEYERAEAAAKSFANTSSRATQLQQGTTGGKIPTGPAPGVASGLTSKITGFINLPELTAQAQIVAQTKAEFDALADAIALAEARMKMLNVEDEEFKSLGPVVEQGKAALSLYEKATNEVSESTLSLRGQIRQGREELVKMEQAGKSSTKEYIEMEKRVAKLTDAYGDQQARIKTLSSDTKALDFGKEAITSAISGFQAYASISILAGGASEELQKKTMQLFAAMQLLTALEQLSNTLRREGKLATLAQAGAQSVYTAVVGASTGALKAFRVAMLATGIGAAVVGIGLLVSKLSQAKKEISEAAQKQKLFNEILAEGKNEYVKAVVEVENLKIAFKEARDGVITKEQAVKLYNDTIGKTTGSVKSLDEAEKALVKNAEAYIKFTLLKAAANTALNKAAQLTFDIAFKQQDIPEFDNDPRGNKAARAAAKRRTEIDALEKQRAMVIDIQKSFQADVQKIAQEFNFDILGLGDKGVTKNKIENVFVQKLKELQARLSAATAKSFESEGTIRKQFAASLEKELFSIDELLKKKQLTSPQAAILKKIIENISGTELNSALGVFRDKQKEALKKIQDSIDEAMLDAGAKSIQNIRDEFVKEAAVIEQESSAALLQLSKKQADLFRQIDKDTESGLISKAVAKRKKFILALVFGDLANQVEAEKATKQVDLAYKEFQALLEDISSWASEKDVRAAERLAELIRDERDKFDAGLITFKKFQDNVTAITKDAAAARKDIRRAELQDQLAAVNASLEAADDPKIISNLKKKQLELRLALASADTETEGGAEDPNKKRKESLMDYVNAVSDLTQSIISFWQKANEAESQALDRSIALQEKRVEAAQRIAVRGNAQYLKQEEDRLKELQIKKENAARRELAINAALQSSQLLVGITGAISKIATPGIGIAEVIASMAIIFASLASGYGLVKSLQGSQPKLAAGTKSVRRNGHPSGTDTIPAWLNEDEAVIPTHRNRAYRPSVSAIYDGTVPADAMNNFVNNYHRVKGVPRPDFNRIKDAAEMSVGYDGRLLEELKENNNLQRQTLRAMKNMSVSASIDRNGVAIAVNEYISQMEIDNRI